MTRFDLVGRVVCCGDNVCVLAVTVHGVALPDDHVARFFHCFDVGGQMCGDLVAAVAGDQGHLANLAMRVEDVEERAEVRGGHGGTNFDTYGIGEATEELYVRVGRLTCAVADPQEVRGGGVVTC